MRRMLAATALALFAGSVITEAAEVAKPVVKEEKVIDFYGLAQYRLRVRINTIAADTVKSMRSVDYTNQIGYYAGMKAKIGDQVSLQFQIGNDWITTEAVDWKTNNFTGDKSGLYPFFHLAYARWDAGVIHVAAGIQPMVSYGALELTERGMRMDAGGRYSYRDAANIGWSVGTNNSLASLSIGAPIVTGDVKLGIDLYTTTTAIRSQSLAVKNQTTVNDNPSAVMFIGNLPFSWTALTVTPQVVVVMNKLYNKTTEKGDMEYEGGLAAGYKVNPMVSITASGAYGKVTNANSLVPGLAAAQPGFTNPRTIVDTTKFPQVTKTDTTWDATAYSNVGMLIGIGTTIKAGPGTLAVDFKYGSFENKNLADSKSQNIFADLKYGWDITKNFSVMPRFRLFTTLFGKKDPSNTVKYPAVPPTILAGEYHMKNKIEFRPELIITGKF